MPYQLCILSIYGYDLPRLLHNLSRYSLPSPVLVDPHVLHAYLPRYLGSLWHDYYLCASTIACPLARHAPMRTPATSTSVTITMPKTMSYPNASSSGTRNSTADCGSHTHSAGFSHEPQTNCFKFRSAVHKPNYSEEHRQYLEDS